MLTHKLQIAVYHRDSGLRVHKFAQTFTYYAYLELSSVYPLLASEHGGTPLTIVVNNLLTDNSLYESPLQCRFAIDFSPQED